MSMRTEISSKLSPFRHRLARAALSVALLPGAAMAQQANRRAAGGGAAAGAGMAGMMGAGDMRQAVQDLDLAGDEKSKVDAILQKAQSDLREAMQGLRDAAPEERQDKVKDLVKMIADTKDKVYAALTPDKQAELAKSLAGLSVKHAIAGVDAEKKKVADLDVPADKKKQADDEFADTTKSLEGYKPDAEAAKDEAGETKVAQEVQKEMMDLNRQLVQILGAADARQVVQAGRAAMNGRTAGAGAAGAGVGARRRQAATTPAGN